MILRWVKMLIQVQLEFLGAVIIKKKLHRENADRVVIDPIELVKILGEY